MSDAIHLWQPTAGQPLPTNLEAAQGRVDVTVADIDALPAYLAAQPR